MNGIAILTAGAAPAVGARRGHTRGRAKPARASGTPSDLSPARTATRHRVASGPNRFFGETRALRTARMGPVNMSKASRDVKVRHRAIPVPHEPTPHRRFQKLFSLFQTRRFESHHRFSNASRPQRPPRLTNVRSPSLFTLQHRRARWAVR